jgi:acyl dehydratase
MDGLIAGLGWEHKILRAVRPGDSVMLRGCLTERRPSKKDSSRLIVTGRDCLFNQDDELVFEVLARCLVQSTDAPAA